MYEPRRSLTSSELALLEDRYLDHTEIAMQASLLRDMIRWSRLVLGYSNG